MIIIQHNRNRKREALMLCEKFRNIPEKQAPWTSSALNKYDNKQLEFYFLIEAQLMTKFDCLQRCK